MNADLTSAAPRLRQAVLAATDLAAVSSGLRDELRLSEPFADPGVAHFGLHNAVFALTDTFLEVVSPLGPGTSAGRLLDRRGGDCGYMLMFQVEDLVSARERARAAGIREVFEVMLDDIAEVHLHPADMRGAIVSLSRPEPRGAWRWGGPDWEARSAPLRVAGATIAVADPAGVAERWRTVVGGPLPMIHFERDDSETGLAEVMVEGAPRRSITIGGVRFVSDASEEEQ